MHAPLTTGWGGPIVIGVNRAARLWWGGGLAALGVVCWALALAIFAPAVQAGADTVAELFRARTAPVLLPGAEEVAQMEIWPMDLRWGAIVLALGGLLIAVSARTAVAVAALAWLALDIAVTRNDIVGWQAFAALVGGVGTVLAAGVWAAYRFLSELRDAPAGRGILVYCGIAAALTPLMFNVDPTTKPFRPQAMILVAILVSLGLALCAVLAALTAGPPAGDIGLNRMLTFAVVVAGPTIAAQFWFAEVHYPDAASILVLPWAATPILLVGCVLQAVGPPSTRVGWVGMGLQAAVVSGMSFVLIWFGLVLSLLVRAEYYQQPDGYQIVIGGLVAGPLIGVVAMVGERRQDAF